MKVLSVSVAFKAGGLRAGSVPGTTSDAQSP